MTHLTDSTSRIQERSYSIILETSSGGCAWANCVSVISCLPNVHWPKNTEFSALGTRGLRILDAWG